MTNANTATAIALALGLATGMTMTSPIFAAEQKGGTTGTQQQHQTASQAGQAAQGQQQGQQYSKEELRARADQLIGQNVVNRDGTDVGELQDIVVDKKSNQPHAVIEVGGILGIAYPVEPSWTISL